MLIKEYRMCMPYTVEEFRIAQRYLVAKASKERTKKGQRVEILENKPFKDERRSGQYTHKIYHVGSSLPGWSKAVIPTSALTVEEKAWNCYPHTKTIITSPFLGTRFSMEIETLFLPDRGENDNVFGLDEETLKRRIVDYIDIAYDPQNEKLEPHMDPRVYKSAKTGRGPLAVDWQKTNTPMMCSYKLCKVEFSYWGLQSKVEEYVHQLAIRDVVLKGHRDSFCWMDEWYGLTMADIDRIEAETTAELQQMNREAEAQAQAQAQAQPTSP